VVTRDDFGDFVLAVHREFLESGAEWENATLERFREALGALALARVVDKQDQETATWQLLAELVAGATGYE